MSRHDSFPWVKTQNGLVVLKYCSSQDNCLSHDRYMDAAETYKLQHDLGNALAELAGLELKVVTASNLLKNDILWDLGRLTILEADYVDVWSDFLDESIEVVRVKIDDGVSILDLTPETRMWVARVSQADQPDDTPVAPAEEGVQGSRPGG